MRVMALERVGQEVTARPGRSPPRPSPPIAPDPIDREQDVDSQPAPEQMGDGQPAQGRRRPQPPGDPDGRIEHPGLRVAGQRPPAESARVPRPASGRTREIRWPIDAVMGQEQEDQVIADGPRVAPVGVVDAGPIGRRRSSPAGSATSRAKQAAASASRVTAVSSGPASRRRPSGTIVGSFIAVRSIHPETVWPAAVRDQPARARQGGPIRRSARPRRAGLLDQVQVALEVPVLGPFPHPPGEPAAASVVAQVGLVDDPPHRREQLDVGAVAEPAAALHARLVDRAAVLVDDDRRPHRERLEHHVAEGLGEQRRDDHRAGAAEQPGQRPRRPAGPRSGRSDRSRAIARSSAS